MVTVRTVNVRRQRVQINVRGERAEAVHTKRRALAVMYGGGRSDNDNGC